MSACTTAALIVAAGRGTRAAAAGAAGPKQYARLGSGTVLRGAIAAFLRHHEIDRVLVVIHPDDRDLYDETVARLGFDPSTERRLLAPALGGASRQQSVLRGLEALSAIKPARVLIHDAARPFVSAGLIDRVVTALDAAPGAIAALPLTDTLKRSDAVGRVTETVPRQSLWRAQTPQGFRFADIFAAHRAAHAAHRDDFTDDAAIAEWHGLPVQLVDGEALNIKITTAEDLRMATTTDTSASEVRTGQGFDVHRFISGDHVWLCGIRIAHTHGVEAHSDGDVGLHALCDALLGAIADGDIGQHFKNTDPRWRGASSDQFVADAARRIAERRGHVVNVDVTLLCEAPKIAPHRDAMRTRIANILGIDVSRVAVKATTTERLGFTGRGEGLAAMAVATVALPSSN